MPYDQHVNTRQRRVVQLRSLVTLVCPTIRVSSHQPVIWPSLGIARMSLKHQHQASEHRIPPGNIAPSLTFLAADRRESGPGEGPFKFQAE